MINSSVDFYIVKYDPDGEGAPHFMEKEWTPELPILDIHIKAPSLSDFASEYNLKAKSYKLDGDYLVEDNLISLDFYNLCREFNVKCICIPANVRLLRNKTPNKKYFLYFNKAYLSILDSDKSVFSISKDIYNGKNNTPEDKNMDKIYYDKIDKFHVIDGISEHLFYCKDIMDTVCSKSFKDKFDYLNLKGVKFIPIDQDYKYDAWEGW